MIIRIYHKYIDNKYSVVEKINAKLIKFDLEIQLVEYNDNRVYRTGERSLDSRLDRAIMQHKGLHITQKIYNFTKK